MKNNYVRRSQVYVYNYLYDVFYSRLRVLLNFSRFLEKKKNYNNYCNNISRVKLRTVARVNNPKYGYRRDDGDLASPQNVKTPKYSERNIEKFKNDYIVT